MDYKRMQSDGKQSFVQKRQQSIVFLNSGRD